jgi:hypothetical protein
MIISNKSLRNISKKQRNILILYKIKIKKKNKREIMNKIIMKLNNKLNIHDLRRKK